MSYFEEVKIEEFNEEFINGSFRVLNETFVAAPTSTTVHDFSYPYNFAMLEAYLYANGLNTGDSFRMDIAPDTIVGAITQAVTAGSTEVSVTSTAMLFAKCGDYIKLNDFTNAQEFIVIEADTVNNTLTLDTSASFTFSPLTPTYVMYSKVVADNFVIVGGSQYDHGSNKIGGSEIPANTTIRISYTNTGPEEVTVSPAFDILY
jgi:hypothetical protein